MRFSRPPGAVADLHVLGRFDRMALWLTFTLLRSLTLGARTRTGLNC